MLKNLLSKKYVKKVNFKSIKKVVIEKMYKKGQF